MRKSAIFPKALALAMSAIAICAAAQTASVPLTTIPNAPQSGTLSNGVTWSVNIGLAWVVPGAGQPGAAYYGFRPMDGVQTWTFSEAVDLVFVVNGLQGPDEGVVLPPGTQCTVPATSLGVVWESATSTLVHRGLYNGPSGGVHVPCTLNNVSSLTLNGASLGPADYRRGLASLTVTRQSSMTAAISGVPATMTTGQSATGTLVCTNAGPGTAANADCVPSVASGGVAVSNVVCTPQPPVASLPFPGAISCTFTATANAAGPAVVQGTATGGTGAPATATAQVTVSDPSSMTAAFTGVPATMTAGQSATGTLVCTNAGPGAAANADCVPSVASGGVAVSNVLCAPQTPVASLPFPGAISCTFTVTANAAGPAGLQGTASGGTGAPANAAASLTVTGAPTVQSPQPVPTLGHLGLALLGGAMGLLAMRRRKH